MVLKKAKRNCDTPYSKNGMMNVNRINNGLWFAERPYQGRRER